MKTKEEITEEYIKNITLIANEELNKKYPDLSIKEWETKYILWANKLFDGRLKE